MAEKGSFASDLRTLLESGEGADVTLVVGESELPAHSFILAARSPVFAAMLRNDMQEANSRRIEVPDLREAALRQMLCFIYTDATPELESVAADLLAAADKYDLPLLKKRCEQQLSAGVSVENAAATAALAVLHRCPGLASCAVRFIASHPEVMATAGWERMLTGSARVALEVCKQLAAAPALPAQPKTATKVTSTVSQSPENSPNRAVPLEIKQEMAAKLIEAAAKGLAGEVWALLAAGAPKDARDTNGNTALHLAAAGGHASTVKCLLDGGLDVNAVNSSGQTPLHMATRKGDTDVMWMLVAASARVDAQDDQGQTPLHVAAQKQYPRIISYPPDCCNHCNNEYTSTHYLCHIVKVLLMAGARKDIKNISGKTPENVASIETSGGFRT